MTVNRFGYGTTDKNDYPKPPASDPIFYEDQTIVTARSLLRLGRIIPAGTFGKVARTRPEIIIRLDKGTGTTGPAIVVEKEEIRPR